MASFKSSAGTRDGSTVTVEQFWNTAGAAEASASLIISLGASLSETEQVPCGAIFKVREIACEVTFTQIPVFDRARHTPRPTDPHVPQIEQPNS